MATKLPLTVRKSLRDNWENKKADFEEKLSSILGVPWTFNYDTNGLYQIAVSSGLSGEPISDPGSMYANYTQALLENMKDFVKAHEEDGKTELNALASAHEVNLVPDNEGKYGSGGSCEIVDGKLRLVFEKSNLGYWVSDISRYIDNAVNVASQAVSPITFIARRSIKSAWDANVDGLRQKFQGLLQIPEITLDPNFAANFGEVKKLGTGGPSDWEKSFGQTTLDYFQRLFDVMEQDGYGKDDMLREGFTEVVEMNKVTLRVTEKLVHKSYNELHIEEGVLYIQTTPDNWSYWVNDIGSSQKLESLL